MLLPLQRSSIVRGKLQDQRLNVLEKSVEKKIMKEDEVKKKREIKSNHDGERTLDLCSI